MSQWSNITVLDYILFSVVVVFLTYGCGLIVRLVLDRVTNFYTQSKLVEITNWDDFISVIDDLTGGGKHAGVLIGSLERLLYFGAIYVGAWAIIPAWLGIKVATKWQAWGGLFENLTVKDWDRRKMAQAQRYLRWRISQRFLIGSLLNILLSALVYAVYARLYR